MATGSVVGSDKQRTEYDKGILPADRQRRLEDLPGWTWDPKADQWEEGFSRLLHYVETPRRRPRPASYTVDGYRLGTWVMQATRQARRRHPCAPTAERRLEDLPGWTWDPSADQWEEGYSRLLDYVEHHGDARVPASYTVDGYRLGAWVGSQRAKHAKGHT